MMIICDKKSFEPEVLQAKGTVLVDFYGEGCASCDALLPYVEEFSNRYGNYIKFCKLNTTYARRLAISQKIMGLPVIAIYRDGVKVEELVKDEATVDAIEEMITRHILG